jgi:hypothetical protein
VSVGRGGCRLGTAGRIWEGVRPEGMCTTGIGSVLLLTYLLN